MSNPGKGELALVQAPLLLGSVLDWALLGCLTMQIYTYSISNINDGRGVKALVCAVCLIDIVQTGISTYGAWSELIWRPYGLVTVDSFLSSYGGMSIFAGIVSFMVQCFFARRIWVLRPSPVMRKLVVCIILLAVLQCTASIVYASQLVVVSTYLTVDQAKEAPAIWLAASLLCDILIAGCMSHFLREARSRTPFIATKTVLTKLSVLALQSGFITAVAAGLQLTAFMTSCLVYGHNWDVFFSIILGKLYSATLLASLNARTAVVRVINNQTDVVEIKSDQGIVFKADLSGIGRLKESGVISSGAQDGAAKTETTPSEEHIASDASLRV
ncbi:hypothetical protein PLICRDRAFT_657972 [Plicaturopsis crispa FD-325 SS-3]|nr:hypothetical protein PLICRDRAFT_657972 [Plicaturopsis crispa FD-325 SS-3]